MREQLSLVSEDFMEELPEYLQSQLITYIGNKRALLPFIGKGVDIVKSRLGKKHIRCLDLFSGTGVIFPTKHGHSVKQFLPRMLQG